MKRFVLAVVGLALASTSMLLAGQHAPTNGPKKVVSGGKLLLKVEPVYPAAAKAARIEGTVVLQAVIGKDGHIKQLVPYSGPEILSSAAMDAVRQWIYQPFLLNGEPQDVAAPITVKFTEDGPPQLLTNSSSPSAPSVPAYQLPAAEQGRTRISSAVMMAHVTKRVEPVYPHTGLPGSSIVLRVAIGQDGHVTDVSSVAGQEDLRGPAVEAVRQWEFEPYVLNGKPADIETLVTLRYGR